MGGSAGGGQHKKSHFISAELNDPLVRLDAKKCTHMFSVLNFSVYAYILKKNVTFKN